MSESSAPPSFLDPIAAIDLADHIGAHMLFPDEHGFRERVMRFYASKRALQFSDLGSAQADVRVVADEGERSFLYDAKMNMRSGAIVGQIFREVVGKHELTIATSLSAEIGKLSDAFTAKSKSGGADVAPEYPLSRQLDGRAPAASPRAINDMWDRFAPVRHLWAAWVHGAQIDDPFPCPGNRVLEFLATGEQFREMGASLRLPRSTVTLGAPTAFELPAEVIRCLPKLAPLSFETIATD